MDSSKVSGIYRITNTASGMFYIGSSCDIKKRHREHRLDLRKGIHDNNYLQEAWIQDGEDAFTWEVVEAVSSRRWQFIREQYWIEWTNACSRDVGYNIARFAGRPPGNKRVHKAHRRPRIEITNIRRIASEGLAWIQRGHVDV